MMIVTVGGGLQNLTNRGACIAKGSCLIYKVFLLLNFDFGLCFVKVLVCEFC